VRSGAQDPERVPENGIRERAAELVRLNDTLHRAYAEHDGSQEREESWRFAVARFWEALATFYAPFEGLPRRIRDGDRAAVDEAVRFLEADPWCFRSGYLKADLMTALANVALTEHVRRRLRGAVIHRLRHREPRLIRPAGQLAANVWDEGLEREVARLQASGTESEQADASEVRRAVEHKFRTLAGRGTTPPTPDPASRA
jgi:hypothetical protein